MYDKKIKKILNTNDIPSSINCKRFITQKFKIFRRKRYIINDEFNNRLKNRIYSWYVDRDFLLLTFMCQRGCFREDIFKKFAC